MFEVARRQAASMPGQPLPSGLTVEDITSFNYTSFYSQLQTSVPMLHSVVRGSMAGHFTFHEVTGCIASVILEDSIRCRGGTLSAGAAGSAGSHSSPPFARSSAP
jgi:hypothetical protein